jgi:hypothetical protein
MTPGMATPPAAMALPPHALVYDAKGEENGPGMAVFQQTGTEPAACRDSVLPPSSAA